MEEKLIALFRNNPCLYNKGHKEFSHLKKRNEKLAELSKKLRVPVRKLKDRWRTLRDTYQKEKKRLATVDDPGTVRKWKWMDHMAFLDETTEYSENLISETTTDYFDETCTEYDKTNSSWNEHFNYEDVYQNSDKDYDNTEADEAYLEPKVKIVKINPMCESLLLPIKQKQPKQKYLNQNIVKSEEYAEPKSGLNIEEEILMDIKTDEERPLENDILWEPSSSSSTLPKKSSIKLFCDSLAVQIEEANLTRYQVATLQIEFLKKLQEFLPKDK